jgi:hypothetical protein
MEDDFISEEVVEIDVKGRKFLYKPSTNEQDLKFASECIKNKDKDPNVLYGEQKLKNIVGVPYKKEKIKKITNSDKEWKDLEEENRIKFLFKLKRPLFNELAKKIGEVESNDTEEKKNSV